MHRLKLGKPTSRCPQSPGASCGGLRMYFEFTRYRRHLPRLVRFGTTGVLATAIHVAVATTLIAGFGWPPYVGNAIAFLLATTASYFINTQWSFESCLSERTLRRYVVVATLGCLLTVAISATAQVAGIDYRFGILLVIALVTPITFLLHNQWTYRSVAREQK